MARRPVYREEESLEFILFEFVLFAVFNIHQVNNLSSMLFQLNEDLTPFMQAIEAMP